MYQKRFCVEVRIYTCNFDEETFDGPSAVQYTQEGTMVYHNLKGKDTFFECDCH